jgi:methylated-DNA-[protein]-cysteine S-methyltransferase
MLASLKFPSPVGTLTLVANPTHLLAVLWEDDDATRVPLPPSTEAPNHPVLQETAQQLEDYFNGTRTIFTLPLEPEGTPFQQQVWGALATIPCGETRSYGQLAQQLGHPNASRAVGAANGRNPISIILPCHRVVGANGCLTGFVGGITAKRWLLNHEQRHAPQSQPSFF